jgi:hypothetical protein
VPWHVAAREEQVVEVHVMEKHPELEECVSPKNIRRLFDKIVIEDLCDRNTVINKSNKSNNLNN